MGQDEPTKTTTETPEQTRLRELRERLDAAKAAREEAELRRSKRFEAEDLEREIAREVRDAEETAKLEELEAEHGRHGDKIWALRTELGLVVVRRPTPAKYQAFMDRGKTSQAAQESFVRDFLVYPDKTTFNSMVAATPALIGRCADALIYLAGWRQREEAAGKSATS